VSGFWLLVWTLGGAALVMVVQQIPLPYRIFAAIDPAADRFLHAWDLSYMVGTPATHPLSLTPSRTALTLALFGALSILFLGLLRFLPRIRLQSVVTRLTVVALVIAVLAVVEKAAAGGDPQRLVYGFWMPQAPGNIFGPFINRNHFAGWMLMMLPLTAGYSWAVLQSTPHPAIRDWRGWINWSTRPEASRFFLAAVAVMGLGASLTLSGSRSGIGGLAVAVLAFGYFMLRHAGSRGARRAVLAYAALLLAGAVAWGGVGLTTRRFAETATDLPGRVSVWKDAGRIIRDFPIFGTGFGGFGRVMLVYQTAPRDTVRNGVYEQAHNDYLQIAAEGGALGAIPAAMFIGLVAVGISHRLREAHDDAYRYWIRIGAICGLLAIAAQSMLEFSLQLTGNTVLFVFLLAVALHPPPTPHAHRV
jgi:O-antigen ligase